MLENTARTAARIVHASISQRVGLVTWYQRQTRLPTKRFTLFHRFNVITAYLLRYSTCVRMGNNASQPGVDVKGDETCVICQEHINNRISRPNCCPNHFFHHDCLMEWAKHKNTCPLDNKEFSAVIDRKGNKFAVTKPKEDSVELLSNLFERMLLLTQLLRTRFHCDLCGEEHSDLERAKTDVCDHRFHRKCLTNLARISSACPVDNCSSEFTEIRCEFGEVLPMRELRDACECPLCHERVEEEETATPNACGHRFHRRCLYSAAKKNKRCPACHSDVLFLRCEKGERVVIQNSVRPIPCHFCAETDGEKEVARIAPCGHQFHRECLLSRYRDMSTCPMDGCNATIELVHCQFGDNFEKQDNPINNLIATVTCGDDFQCRVCSQRKPEWERAKLDCGCEFHRRCIVQVARRQTQLLCLSCNQPYTTITCLHGDSLTVERRQPVANAEASSEAAELAIVASEAAEPAIASSEAAEGAVGGSDLRSCSLCEAEIPAGEATRPASCDHWYHTVCMDGLTGAVGCCIACQADLSTLVNDALGENSQPTPAASEDAVRCFTCGDVMAQGQAVRPDGCLCVFHRHCFNSIKEIMSFCPVCDANFSSAINVA